MENDQPVEETAKRRKGSPPKGRKSKSRGKAFPAEVRLKAMKMLEEGFAALLVAEEIGCSLQSIWDWRKRYRQDGATGLADRPRRPRTGIESPVRAKIVALKVENRQFGMKRISQLLRRIFFMKASPTTVGRVLQEENLADKAKKKPETNPARPRFFERSTPNQMWQTDIFSFRLGGKSAYLIGFIDDYSRYMTGLGLYRSMTAENVLEVYRTAVGEYNVPKEMLTDNGRQYTNWRGTTRFEAELAKDRIKHIKSRPHHPMTLGKIERFWKTIFGEYLSRAQFGSFEEARERIALWVKYYNHRRPHQGIEGLCPADRFFEIAHKMKKTMEQGIAENVLEIALRGKPRDPFYMVGRMDGQSVVIRAEKGKVKMSLEGDGEDSRRELEYTINKEENHGEESHEEPQDEPSQRLAALPGRPEPVDGKTETGADLPGAGHQLADPEPLAGSGHGGNASGFAAEGQSGRWSGAESAPGGAAGKKEGQGGESSFEKEGDQPTGKDPGRFASHPQGGREKGAGINNVEKRHEEGLGSSGQGGDHHSGSQRPVDGDRSGTPAGDEPQELLPVGEAGAGRPDEISRTGHSGPTSQNRGPGESGDAKTDLRPGTGAGSEGSAPENPRAVFERPRLG